MRGQIRRFSGEVFINRYTENENGDETARQICVECSYELFPPARHGDPGDWEEGSSEFEIIGATDEDGGDIELSPAEIDRAREKAAKRAC